MRLNITLTIAMPLLGSILLPLWCYASPPPTLEQLLEIKLSEVNHELDVETAGRTAQNSRQHGNLTYIITADEIRLFGMRTLAEIIDHFPGVYISRDPAFSYVGIRGLGQPNDFNSRLLFLLDGIRLNEAVFDAGMLGTDGIIDVENIEHVEFSAGPGAAAYGNNAFFGVIQIFSKKAARGEHVIQTSVASQGTERYRLAGAHRYDNANEIYASFSHENIGRLVLGLQPPAEIGAAYEAASNEHINRFRLGGKLGGMQLQALLSEQRRHLPAVLEDNNRPRLAISEDQNQGTLLAAQYQTSGDLWQLAVSASVSGNNYRRLQPFINPLTGSIDDILAVQRSQWNALHLIGQYDGWTAHQLMTGIERHQAVNQDIRSWQVSSGRLLQNIQGELVRQSWFVQDTWQIQSDQFVSLGVRLDDGNSERSRWSPRVSWSWQAVADTQLKFQYGTAFRNANHYETGNNLIGGATPPAAEQIKSTEFSVEHLLNRQFGVRLTLFRSDIEQLIVTQGLYVNAIPLASRGTELTAQWRGAHGQDLSIGWSWQQSDFSGLTPLNSPRHLLKMLYQQALWQEDWRLSLSAQSRSGRWATEQYLPGYAHWQFGLVWQATPEHQISFQLQNAFDKHYQHQPLTYTPPLSQPGRQFSLSWQWQLP